ncbi:SCO family protein [Kangiella sediminilitoris]|uniref:Electron transport protein SCO1/SenC n=1 Tax=Kangiella sediminilitoris TaxID=1144748 RepID=A0A1B3B8A8_9GAMM|nr:SCO family protein [Kangiella sediminilitoris]AOE49001.1 Electron transport protein SCO1/SenC [Kangiella sediminilitoris]
MTKQHGSARLIIILVALLSIVIGVVGYQVLFAEKKMELIRNFDQPRSIVAFEGKSHNGDTYTESDFLGQWSIVFFGFTTCPDICPTAMTNINGVMKNIDPEFKKDTQVVMMSVDPERDTLDKLAKYVPAFNPEFIGVNAGWDETQKVAKSVGVSFYKVPVEGRPDDYTIDHTARWFVIDPLGRRYAYISPNQVQRGKDLIQVVASDYNILREKAGELHSNGQ